MSNITVATYSLPLLGLASALPFFLPVPFILIPAVIFFTLFAAHYYVTFTSTVFFDEENLKKPSENKGHTAVVVGGSVAGVLAARILLDHYERVIILESEDLDPFDVDKRGLRKNVPQTKYIHAILPLTTRIVEEMFPGITDFYIKSGGMLCYTSEQMFHMYGRLLLRNRVAGTQFVMASRRLLEGGIRTMLLKTYGDRVEYRTSVVARSLCMNENDIVCGVTYYDSKEAETIRLAADFVIDATGRNARGVQWLKHLDKPIPPADTYDPYIEYSGATYTLSHPVLVPSAGFLGFGYPGKSSETFTIGRIEGNECLIGAMSIAVPHRPMPMSNAEMDEWIDKCEVRETAKLLKAEAEKQVTEYTKYRIPPSRFLRYDLITVPGGFAAVGDAVCSFNPIHGQGITTAAIAALTLSRALRTRKSPKDISNTHHKLLRSRLLLPWFASQVSDLRYEAVKPCAGQSKDDWLLRILSTFFESLIIAAQTDPYAQRCLFRMIGMVAYPREMFHPRVLWAVAKVTWKMRSGILD